MDVDLEDLVNLEQQFYDVGYKEGLAHGRVHGLIEGRALGKEKGFEMWEEVGFYLGFATMWKGLLQLQPDSNAKLLSHLSHLLELVASFPIRNPSKPHNEGDTMEDSSTPEVDISAILSRMRARYRVCCSGLGVRPRLPSSNVIEPMMDQEELSLNAATSTEQGVDLAEQNSKPTVWSFADATKKAGVGGMAF